MTDGTLTTFGRIAAAPSNRRGGFTLIELVAVIVVIAIMAAAAAPALSGLESMRTHAAVSHLRRDLLLARHVAVATGMRTWIVFDVEANAYEVFQEPSGNPGREERVLMTDAGTGRSWSSLLSRGGFSSVTLDEVDIAGEVEVGFDFRGRSLSADEAILDEEGQITFDDTEETIVIRARTGHVE